MKKDICKFYKKDKRRIIKGLGFFKGGELKNLKQELLITPKEYQKQKSYKKTTQ